MDSTNELRHRLNGIFGMLTAMKLLLVIFLFYTGDIIRAVAGNDAAKIIEAISDTTETSGVLFYTVLSLVCIAVPALVWFIINGKRVASEKPVRTRRPKAMETLCGIGVTVAAARLTSFVFTLISMPITRIFGLKPEDLSLDIPQRFGTIVLYVIYIAVIPALFEELTTRGIVLGGTRKWGVGFAIVISSVAFSMLHNTISQLPFALVTGLCIGYMAVRFDSIWVGVAAHFVINFDSFMTSFLLSDFFNAAFGTYGTEMTDENMSALISALFSAKTIAWAVWALIMFIFVAVFAVLFFVFYGFKKLNTPENDAAQTTADTITPKASVSKALFTCPCFYTFAALFIFVAGKNLMMLL